MNLKGTPQAFVAEVQLAFRPQIRGHAFPDGHRILDRSPSWNFPSKLSMSAFCTGLPGSMQ
jgi:hypothetical protein